MYWKDPHVSRPIHKWSHIVQTCVIQSAGVFTMDCYTRTCMASELYLLRAKNDFYILRGCLKKKSQRKVCIEIICCLQKSKIYTPWSFKDNVCQPLLYILNTVILKSVYCVICKFFIVVWSLFCFHQCCLIMCLDLFEQCMLYMQNFYGKDSFASSS